jgi:DNA invertase Pin-like site-specific DNA recombinase
VSVTQSFNTSSSMGRLMLNVLLSFAQFERELIGERVRDKIGASKRKGLWVGGPVPLGYAAVNKKILVIAAEVARASVDRETVIWRFIRQNRLSNRVFKSFDPAGRGA